MWPQAQKLWLAAMAAVQPPCAETDPPTVSSAMWQWKTGALFLTACLVASTPTLSETSREAAEVVAARHARTCYVEMMDGQLKCGGRPQRSLAAARALLGPGTFAKADEPSACHAGKPIWVFKWRGFPKQVPIVIDAQTGKLIECRP